MSRIVACLVALVALTACGAQGSTSASAPRHHENDRAEASPKVSVAVPTIPPAARRNSRTGATAFAAYYLDVRNYALQTGDTTELTRITSPECLMCLQTPVLIETTYRAGGHIVGGLWLRTTNVFAPRIAGSDPKGNGLLETQVHLMPMKVIAADGDVAGTYDGSHHDRGLTITTRWDHGRWMVDGILTIGGQQL